MNSNNSNSILRRRPRIRSILIVLTSKPPPPPTPPNSSLVTLTSFKKYSNNGTPKKLNRLTFLPSVQSSQFHNFWPTTTATQCPPPKAALIGIFTTSEPTSAEKRTLLRQLYRSINNNNAQVPIHQQIDFRFVFGNAKTFDMDYEIAVEEMLFPNETVVFEALEDRDSGKILDWFRWVREHMYEPIAVQEGRQRWWWLWGKGQEQQYQEQPQYKWCLKYQYVGKGDEDAVFELTRLGKKLFEISRLGRRGMFSTSAFIGRIFPTPWIHMTGMLYLLSADIVEWINFSPIPVENLAGVEDIQVGKWLLEGGFYYRELQQGLHFHDLEESHQWSPGPIKDYSTVVHWCKDMARMYRCISGLFHNHTIAPEVAHRLTLPTNLATRIKRFGLTILKSHISQWITRLGLDSELTTVRRNAIIHHVSIRGYLKPHTQAEIDELIVKFIVRVANIPKKKYLAKNDWKINWNENGMAADGQKLSELVKMVLDGSTSDADGIVDPLVVEEMRKMIGDDPSKSI
ncbi:hypothetical protein BDR26DRAFT_871745 [Obelidium mucronatum]|nr:hypothetical protein BDR26DRAFT_871745 [Obelidium mucronatum]